MPRITDPALLSQLETPQTQINKSVSRGGMPSATLTGDARNQAVQKLNALKLLREQMVRSSKEFDAGQNGQGLFQSAREMLPGLFNGKNARFDSTVSGMVPLAKAAFRVPGSGSDSDKESDAFMALLPSRYSNDAGNIGRYRQMAEILKQSIGQQRRSLGLMPKQGGPAPAAKPRQAPAVIDFNHLPE